MYLFLTCVCVCVRSKPESEEQICRPSASSSACSSMSCGSMDGADKFPEVVCGRPENPVNLLKPETLTNPKIKPYASLHPAL